MTINIFNSKQHLISKFWNRVISFNGRKTFQNTSKIKDFIKKLKNKSLWYTSLLYYGIETKTKKSKPYKTIL